MTVTFEDDNTSPGRGGRKELALSLLQRLITVRGKRKNATRRRVGCELRERMNSDPAPRLVQASQTMNQTFLSSAIQKILDKL